MSNLTLKEKLFYLFWGANNRCAFKKPSVYSLCLFLSNGIRYDKSDATKVRAEYAPTKVQQRLNLIFFEKF